MPADWATILEPLEISSSVSTVSDRAPVAVQLRNYLTGILRPFKLTDSKIFSGRGPVV